MSESLSRSERTSPKVRFAPGANRLQVPFAYESICWTQLGGEAMPPLPWRTITVPNPNQECVALLSFLPLKHYRTIPLFLWLTFKTQQQLKQAEGLVGYSLQAEPLSGKFWTLSAWKDQQSLMYFVHQLPHSKIMQVLAPYMDKTQFVQWKVTGYDIPLTWDVAKVRMHLIRAKTTPP